MDYPEITSWVSSIVGEVPDECVVVSNREILSFNVSGSKIIPFPLNIIRATSSNCDKLIELSAMSEYNCNCRDLKKRFKDLNNYSF